MSATSVTTRVSWADVEQTWAALASHGLAVQLDFSGPGSRWRWGLFTDQPRFVETITRYADQDLNFYVGLNPRKPIPPLNRLRDEDSPTDEEIPGLIRFLLDADVERPKDQAASDDQVKQALKAGEAMQAWFVKRGLKRPCMGFSGNGVQLWPNVPAFPLTAENRDSIRRKLKAFHALLLRECPFDGIKLDFTTDLRRLGRLFGTLNAKAGRLSRWITPPESDHADPALLEFILSLEAEPETPRVAVTLGEFPRDLPAHFQELLASSPKLKATWEGNRPDLIDQSGSGYDLALADLLVRNGFSDDEIAAILMGAPYAKATGRSGAYLERTISKALAGAGAKTSKDGGGGDRSSIEVRSSLPQAIRAVILKKDIAPFDKRREVAQLVEGALRQYGRFCRTADGRLFYFSRPERRLYDLDQRDFQHLVTSTSGLSSTEPYFRFALDVLQASTSQEAPLVEVHTLAWFDPASGVLAISDGGEGMWVHEQGGAWKYGQNGDHDLLFLTEPEATPWTPEFGANGEALQWFLSQFLFAAHPLSRDDQQTLFHLWFLQQFFPRLRRTRVIPACLGPQGSGKTTAERLPGRLLLGPHFDVSGIHREREDAFVAAVTNRVIFGLDNADSRIPWLEDALARYATGERYRLRRLYTTNEEVSYTPRAILMLSSRDPQFNRPDVAERLLPLHFERPTAYKPEEEIYTELETRRGAVMGALLTQLAEIADSLESLQAPPLSFRMADFAAFGWRVFARLGQAREWEALLGRLEIVQSAFASDGDGVVAALGLLLKQEGAIHEEAVGDLFKRCRVLAEQQDLLFPKTAQVFGRRLSTLRRVLELSFGVRFSEEYGHGGFRRVSLVPQRGDDGGDGDGVREKVSSEIPL